MATGGSSPKKCGKKGSFREQHNYLLKREMEDRADYDAMKRNQPRVTTAERTKMVDWMIDQCWQNNKPRLNFYRAVDYMDRYMSKNDSLMDKNQFYVLAVTCLFLAEKVGSRDVSPEVYSQMTKGFVSSSCIIEMEKDLFKTLKFEMELPTVIEFADLFLNRIGADEGVRNLTHFLCELTLVEPSTYLDFPPSVIATTAMCLAYHTLKTLNNWQSWMKQLTRYSLSEPESMRTCTQAMFATFHGVCDNQAIVTKYSKPGLGKIAKTKPPKCMPTDPHYNPFDDDDDLYA